ncbi:MAG: hypothetical protein KFB93_05390 [Simkaniaceae bacterium]|nr:MAG: hypothetical protein KFB93_05390 [Simkaniaceae bacterium]
MIELNTYSSNANPFFEFDVDALDYTASVFPEISLFQIAEQSSAIIREFSPILLGEKPYEPNDNFIVKCLKSVVASSKVLFFKTDEVRAALKAYQASNEVIESLNQRINHLEEEIFDHFNEMLSLQFELELNKCLLVSPDSPSSELIDGFVEAYRAVLDARSHIGSGDHKIHLTPEYKDELCLHKKLQLEEEALQIIAPKINLQERNEVILQRLEQLLQKKTSLTEELHTIEASLQDPLDFQLQQI